MTNEGRVEILLIPEGGLTAEKLKEQLERSAEWDPSIDLKITRPSKRTLGPDMGFITATLPCVTAVVLTLIKAVAEVRKEQNRTEISLEIPGVGVVTVKGAMALKDLDQVLQQLKPKTPLK
jgi:hypothetical protein